MAASASSLTPWQGIRNLVLVGGLSLAAAVAAAIFAEGRYARPLCDAYGRGHGLTYLRFQYPPANPIELARGGSSCYCVFSDGGPKALTVNFDKVAPSDLTYLLVNVSMTIGVTIPLFFVFFVLSLSQIYGALGIQTTRKARKAESVRGERDA